MSNQDAVNAFLNQLNINNTSSIKNKKKKNISSKKKNDVPSQTEQMPNTIKIEENLKVNSELNLKVKIEPIVKEKTKEKIKPISTMAKLALQQKKLIEDEQTRIKLLQEEEKRKIKEEEEKAEIERKKLEEERNIKKQKKRDKILAQKNAGTYKTQSQKEKERYEKIKFDQMMKNKDKVKKVEYVEKVQVVTHSYGEINPNYKSIISCIMGHVDTGKTLLLDKIRNTNVQKGEVGGITQQIGATFIPRNTLIEKVDSYGKFNIEVPGILMIDTPGHEAFANLRLMGSNICDIAVLVIDLTHGLETQTIESMKMLRDSKTPFIIALNKIDRLYRWVKNPDSSFQFTFEKQESNTQNEFNDRLNKIIVQIMEQGFNAKLYWENDSPEDTLSICPTSAITGEGLSDLLATLINWSQLRLQNEITYSNNLNCVLMESTKVEGFGLTIDAILINGELKVGDNIILNTLAGKFSTNIRSLLTPPPNRESRIKSEFLHHEIVKGAIGVKLVVNGLESTGIPGSYITNNNEKTNLSKSIVKEEIVIKENKFKLQDKGVIVHASTIGSLEALVKYLQVECVPPVPISQVNIGKVTKKDVTKTHLINEKSFSEFKSILAFNVDVDEEAEIEAKNYKVKIFKAEIIYNLFDSYVKYKNDSHQQRKDSVRDKMVFPCILKILPNCVFNKKNPLVFGVEVIEGNLHLGTDLSDPITNTYIGKVIGIQNNNKDVEIGKKSTSVCVKIDNQEMPTIMYGRQFDHTNILYSKITRESLNVLKDFFRDECTKEDLLLLVKLKKMFAIE